MTYVPVFESSDVPCELPTYIETRSRNILGGIYFRSRVCGFFDDININCSVEQVSLHNETVTLSYTYKEEIYGPYVVSQHFDDINNVYLSNVVDDLRSLVNTDTGPIHMPGRGFDVHDFGQDPDHIEDFGGTLVGGLSGPVNDDVLASIRTGPKYSLICITSTENEQGANITPTEKIRQWSGTEWIIFEE